jgi:hypothetical protein
VVGMVTAFVGNHETVSEICSARVSNIQIRVSLIRVEGRAGQWWCTSHHRRAGTNRSEEVRISGFAWTWMHMPGEGGGNGRAVEIDGAFELGPRRELGIDTGTAQQVERKSRAWGIRRSFFK